MMVVLLFCYFFFFFFKQKTAYDMRISDWSSDVCSSDLCYKRYEFHPAVSRLQIFCSEDLGAFYLDVLKDRLYTAGKTSVARRSAQTAVRSEERRVGKEGVRKSRSRWSRYS